MDKVQFSPAFQSKSERFPHPERSSLGPGSYTLRTEPGESSSPSPVKKSKVRLGSCHDSMKSVKELEMIREVTAAQRAKQTSQEKDITRRAILRKLVPANSALQTKKNVHIEAVYVQSSSHSIQASLRRVEQAAHEVEKKTQLAHGETINVLKRIHNRSPEEGRFKKAESSLPCLNARLPVS